MAMRELNDVSRWTHVDALGCLGKGERGDLRNQAQSRQEGCAEWPREAVRRATVPDGIEDGDEDEDHEDRGVDADSRRLDVLEERVRLEQSPGEP